MYSKPEDLLEALHLMADVVDDNHGNVSCRVDERTICIKPSGMEYTEIEIEDVVYSNMDGTQIDSTNFRKASVDLVNHLAIYRRYPEIKAICHTHSPYVVAFAIAEEGIPCACTEQADRFGGTIGGQYPCGDPDAWGEEMRLFADFSQKATI